MNRHMFRKTFWGLGLIGLGIIFFLERLGWITWGVKDTIFLLWPLILLEIGLNELLFKCKKDVGGWIMTVLGLYFLTRNLGLNDFSIGDLIRMALPLVLVLVGIKMITSKQRNSHKKKHSSDPYTYNSENNQQTSSAPPEPPASSHLDDLFNEKLGMQGKDSSDHTKDSFHQEPAFTEKSKQSSYGYPGQNQEKNYREQQGQRERQGEFRHNPGYSYDWKQHKQQLKQHMRRIRHNKQWHHEQWKNYKKGSCSSSYSNYAYDDPNTEERSGFIGDTHIGKDYFELRPMNISHFIGDTMLDLTRAQIPYGVTRINISAFIGDVKVFIPSGIEVAVKAEGNSFIGDMDILNRSADGMMNHISGETVDSEHAGKRIEIGVSVFIGDIRINRVG